MNTLDINLPHSVSTVRTALPHMKTSGGRERHHRVVDFGMEARPRRAVRRS